MSIEEKLVSILSDGETPVVQGVYYGDSTRFITFDLVSFGADHGDDEPQELEHVIEVRYTCPATESASAARKRIADALVGAGCTFPRVSRETEQGRQTLVFEAEALSGTDWEV